MLKVSPWKGYIRFRERGKLSPRYIGPFNIVSRLRKCLADDTSHVPLVDTEVDERLNNIEQPIEIVDRKEKQLHHNVIPLVKMIWKHCKGSDVTWKVEEEIRKFYPDLFKG
ncbi:uncharacterized protein LOC143598392 [Bidens hawaiensis]|uniref:uncharacterized protein LOC143598392 n=1 Tax=Bidens hawaiensis TaxID=980011 RepID=UPI004049301C